VDLARYLADHGFKVSVLTLSGDDPDAYILPAAVTRSRIDIRRNAKSPWQTIRFNAAAILAMRRRIQAISPDAVIAFIEQTNVRAILSTIGTGIPVIVSERTDPRMHKVGRAWEWARRLTYPLAATVIVQTEAAGTGLPFVPSCRRVTIPNAIRSGVFFPYNDEPKQAFPVGGIIISVGRLEPVKGYDLLVEAFMRSGIAANGWRLILLGEGQERPRLERQIATLDLTEAVSLPGHTANVSEYLHKADVFVLSSRYEGFPNSLLEAMQTGRACISFDCSSGPAEIITHGLDGLLVPAEDVDGLAAALSLLAADANLRSRLGTEARKKVSERYAPDLVYGRWLKLIETQVRQRTMRGAPSATQ
jgi:glycosyltransferase involved in cell wall biosynthesis